jgi:allophanate hydrolase subunit 1
LQKTAGIPGKRFFTLLLFCHIVASYWNQVIAKRNIKNGEEILVAYGSKYAPDLQEENRKAEVSAQKDIKSNFRLVTK